jgi:DNA-binding response OmpR family regulator
MTSTTSSQADTTEKEAVILIVEDDADAREIIELMLKSVGYQTHTASNGPDALALIASHHFDLILLDINMPGMDGYEVARRIKADPAFRNIPIIMVSGRNEVIDQVLGLELGADDYIIKPIEPRLLQARVKARLRLATPQPPEQMVIGKLVIDRGNRSISLGTQEIPVSDAEFDLLWLLASNAGKVLSRDDILRATRGLEYDGSDRSIDMRISRLRKLLGDDGADPKLIKSVRSKGYLFSKNNWDK